MSYTCILSGQLQAISGLHWELVGHGMWSFRVKCVAKAVKLSARWTASYSQLMHALSHSCASCWRPAVKLGWRNLI